MSNKLKPKKHVMLIYLVPCAVMYFLVFIVPVFLAIYYSLFKFKTINAKSFVGLKNYATLLNDANVVTALKNNLFLVVVCLIGQIGIAFILANMINSRLINRRIANTVRTVIYFPVTLSAIVIGYVWWAIYDNNFGLLNYVLNAAGLGQYANAWLANEHTVMWAVCIPMIWQFVGFHLLIMLSAMSSIDPAIYEAAELDGASGIKQALYVTLPMIKPTLIVCVVLCISANLKAFDHIVAMTNGGPGYSSMVLSLYAYRVSFGNANLGYGNAISVATMAVMITIYAITKTISSRIAPDQK